MLGPDNLPLGFMALEIFDANANLCATGCAKRAPWECGLHYRLVKIPRENETLSEGLAPSAIWLINS